MFKSVVSIAVSAVVISLAASPAQALTQFTGHYAPVNWTKAIQGNGSINTSGAPASITLTGANGSPFISGNTDFTISAGGKGIVSFDWAYSTNDSSAFWDPFGYLLNGAFTQLTNNGGGKVQFGSTFFNVLAGDVFGFRQATVDSCCGSASTIISKFNAPVPGPLPLLGAGAAFGWSRQLRRRVGAGRTASFAAGLKR